MVLFCMAFGCTFGQEKPALPPPSAEETARAQAALQAAVDALGGTAFETIKTEVSHGYFTPFENGIPNSSGFLSFTDHLVFPDKERVEFKNGKHHIIQTNVGDKGWRYDSDSPAIEDQTPEQIKHFQQDLRFQLDNLLRQERHQKGLKLRYDPRVPSTTKFQVAEAVTFLLSNGIEVTLLLEPKTHYPIVVRFSGVDASNNPTQEEIRFLQYHSVGNLTLPHILDRFSNGAQTSRINYDKREFNLPVDEKIFARPASLKELK